MYLFSPKFIIIGPFGSYVFKIYFFSLGFSKNRFKKYFK